MNSKPPKPFVKEYFYMLFLIMIIPFVWGVVNVGVRGGVFGAIMAGLMLSCAWMFACYRQAMRCYHEAVSTSRQLKKARSHEQVAHKVTKKLKEELASDLDATEKIREFLIKENGTLTTQVTEAETKDVLIAALRRRSENLNAEYHDKVFGRKVTTLEDVHKLTGDIKKHGNRSKDH